MVTQRNVITMGINTIGMAVVPEEQLEEVKQALMEADRSTECQNCGYEAPLSRWGLREFVAENVDRVAYTWECPSCGYLVDIQGGISFHQ